MRYAPRPEEIPSGLCECGCGARTPIARYTLRALRYFRGHPVPFIQHHGRPQTGEKNAAWRGGRFTHRSGYVYVRAPEHPHANGRGYVFEHRLVVERTIGRLLERGEVVHHRNGQKDDNRPDNLELMTLAQHTRHHSIKRHEPHP